MKEEEKILSLVTNSDKVNIELGFELMRGTWNFTDKDIVQYLSEKKIFYSSALELNTSLNLIKVPIWTDGDLYQVDYFPLLFPSLMDKCGPLDKIFPFGTYKDVTLVSPFNIDHDKIVLRYGHDEERNIYGGYLYYSDDQWSSRRTALKFKI